MAKVELVPMEGPTLPTRIMPELSQDPQVPFQIIYNRKTGLSFSKGKLIGKGGFASVYEVRDLAKNAAFADKIISKEVVRKKASQDKIQREIDLHRKLVHPHVVRFIDTFDDDLYIHIILEYCSMKSLLNLMKKRKVLNEDEVRFFLRQICEGVRYIHRRGIVHRDLKLGNMFLTSNFTIKIGDFGLATLVSNVNGSSLCGTPNYIAPEVLQKKGHGFEADLWAIGCMTFAMMSGNPPFETKSLSSTYAKITSNSYTLPPNLTKPAKSLITQLLHPEPTKRGHLHAALDQPSFILNLPFFSVPSRDNSTETLSTSPPSSKPNWRHKFSQLFSQVDISSSGQTNSSSDSHSKFIHSVIYKLNLLMQNRCSHSEVMEVDSKTLVVSKWIDYSNKYGFGYELSNGDIGVLFNDNVRVSKRYGYITFSVVDADGFFHTVSPYRVPTQFAHYTKIVDHFGKYMEDNLADAGWTCGLGTSTPTTDEDVQVTRWARNDNCVIMMLSNNSVQINFFSSHDKILFRESDGLIKVSTLGKDSTLIISERSSFSPGHLQSGLGAKNLLLFQCCLAELRGFVDVVDKIS